jgi:signal peptidase I
MSFFSKNKITYTGEKSPWWKRGLSFLGELVEVALIVTVIVVPIRYFLVQPFYVKGASMEPNFYDNQYLIIDELTYRFREPARGEIIVFRYPKDESQFFIKRVIGLPGETVTVTGGKVFVTPKDSGAARVVDESSYLPSGLETTGEQTTKLGADEYFVLGDNRSASLDSRFFGVVPKRDIVGRVALRGWPVDELKTFSPPNYGF